MDRMILVTRLTLCFTLLSTAFAGCTSDMKSDSGTNSGSAEKQSAPDRVDDEYHVITRKDTVGGVMQAKLAHAQAILEGITLADYQQVELNAADLQRISALSEFLVHDTPSYQAFSKHFRETTSDLAKHARAKDLDAVTDQYVHMINLCFDCHAYLRKERLVRDMPARISMTEGDAKEKR